MPLALNVDPCLFAQSKKNEINLHNIRNKNWKFFAYGMIFIDEGVILKHFDQTLLF